MGRRSDRGTCLWENLDLVTGKESASRCATLRTAPGRSTMAGARSKYINCCSAGDMAQGSKPIGVICDEPTTDTWYIDTDACTTAQGKSTQRDVMELKHHERQQSYLTAAALPGTESTSLHENIRGFSARLVLATRSLDSRGARRRAGSAHIPSSTRPVSRRQLMGVPHKPRPKYARENMAFLYTVR